MSNKVAGYGYNRIGRHRERIKMKLPEELVFNGSNDENSNEGNEQPDESRQFIDSSSILHREKKEFSEELNRLQKDNNRKFKEKWIGILSKYSQINDETESDELDLWSGKIIRNNGHLMSLDMKRQLTSEQKYEGDVWCLTYDLENEESVEKTRQRGWPQEKDTGRAEKIARIRRSWKSVDVLPCLEDSRLPMKGLFFRKGICLGERSGCYGGTSLKNMKKPPEKYQLLSNGTSLVDSVSDIRCERPPNETTGFYRREVVEKNLVSSAPLRKQKFSRNVDKDPSYRESYCKSNSRLESQNRVSILPTKDNRKSNKNNGLSASLSSRGKDEPWNCTKKSFLEDNDVAPEYLTIASRDLVPQIPSRVKIYNCAFENCFFCTGNKLLYRDHLLGKHKEKLEEVGYPVIATGVVKGLISRRVSEEAILKLNSQFPLVHPVPPLPLSKDGCPYICKILLGGSRRCQKSFLSYPSLVKHQENAPSHCSLRKPLFVCPLLGCGYATRLGYLTWRMHFIEAKHHIHPVDRRKYFGADNKGEILSEKCFYENRCQKKYTLPISPVSSANSKENSINLSEKMSFDSSSSKEKLKLDGITKEIDDMFSDLESEN